MKNIADIRQEYTKSGLRESELPCDPLSLFSRWLQEAIDANVEEPTAVIVGTVSPEGRPSTRTVLLKGLHDGKFIFYTNYESAYQLHPACDRLALWRDTCTDAAFIRALPEIFVRFLRRNFRGSTFDVYLPFKFMPDKGK